MPAAVQFSCSTIYKGVQVILDQVREELAREGLADLEPAPPFEQFGL